MRAEQIKVEPFNYLELKDLQIRQEINEHAKAELSMLIKDEWKEKYIGNLSDKTWVKITGSDGYEENGNVNHTVLFNGLVTDYSFYQDGYETILKLSLRSGTIQMDEKPHFRVFQNEKASYGDILKKITSAYDKGKAVCLEKGEEQIKGTLVQYRESDWEFLKRLVSRAGGYLTAEAENRGVRFYLGLPTGAKRKVETDRIQMHFPGDEFMEKKQNGMDSLQESDLVELVTKDREIYRLGDSMTYQGKEYFLYRMETEYVGNECVQTYHWRKKKGIKVLPMWHSGITGCSFDAKVTGVNRDKVQIEIEKDEWKGCDGKKWFLYSTVYSSPDGTGWYCMPEPGDAVCFQVPDREENSFVISSVHRETDAARQNPDYKSFKNKYGKEILFTPDTLIMTNNQGMMVELNDSEGVKIISDKSISIHAANSLTIASSSDSLLVAADKKVQVKQGGTTMTLEGDISFTGGEFRIQ